MGLRCIKKCETNPRTTSGAGSRRATSALFWRHLTQGNEKKAGLMYQEELRKRTQGFTCGGAGSERLLRQHAFPACFVVSYAQDLRGADQGEMEELGVLLDFG